MGKRLKILVVQGLSTAFMFWRFNFRRTDDVNLLAQIAFNSTMLPILTPLGVSPSPGPRPSLCKRRRCSP